MSNCHPCADFIESVGVLWEADGLPRIAGRIFGYLIVQPEPSSLGQLAAGLGVSKASISTDARRLEQLGFITRISLPGDRRDYYAIDDSAPATGLEMRLRNLRRFDRTLSDVHDRENLPPVVQARLARFEHVHVRIVTALEEILEELKQRDPATLPPAGSPQQ